MSNMINPIIIDEDKNVCPFCGGELVLVQHESTVIRLSKEGIPDDVENIRFKIFGLCKECSKEIKVAKQGLFYKPYCKYLDIKKRLEIEESTANPFYK